MAAVVPTWTLGDRLRRARRDAHLKPIDLAHELGVHPTTITRFEADASMPRQGYLTLWAQRCGVDLEWLQYGDEPPRPQIVADIGAAKNGRRSSSTRWYLTPCEVAA